ncbi:unnamed protein product [Parnassius apollo]|uniref:(apollo) hypothetical protein n=1 Tax=Parnassius apollo TaxID=110799 RepID=A0A8S3WNY3_PARAO|nr:unnamed protein product [Parnassius apollo]CAG4972794.1 unnamed protein product [Parnassius apollo]
MHFHLHAPQPSCARTQRSLSTTYCACATASAAAARPTRGRAAGCSRPRAPPRRTRRAPPPAGNALPPPRPTAQLRTYSAVPEHDVLRVRYGQCGGSTPHTRPRSRLLAPARTTSPHTSRPTTSGKCTSTSTPHSPAAHVLSGP